MCHWSREKDIAYLNIRQKLMFVIKILGIYDFNSFTDGKNKTSNKNINIKKIIPTYAANNNQIAWTLHLCNLCSASQGEKRPGEIVHRVDLTSCQDHL